jgi:hypothetical protein
MKLPWYIYLLWLAVVALAIGCLEWRSDGIWVKISARREVMEDGFLRSYEEQWVNLLRPTKRYFKTLSGDLFAPYV